MTNSITSKRDGRVGKIVSGTVAVHAPWGILLDLDDTNEVCAVEIHSMSDEDEDKNLARFPPIGTHLRVRGIAIGLLDQLRASIKASDIDFEDWNANRMAMGETLQVQQHSGNLESDRI